MKGGTNETPKGGIFLKGETNETPKGGNLLKGGTNETPKGGKFFGRAEKCSSTLYRRAELLPGGRNYDETTERADREVLKVSHLEIGELVGRFGYEGSILFMNNSITRIVEYKYSERTVFIFINTLQED